MKIWHPAPPEPKVHIVKIVELDFNVFHDPFPVNENVLTLGGHIGDVLTFMPNGAGSRPAMSQDMPYLVYFSDGRIARASGNAVEVALWFTGQEWGD